MRYFIIFTIVLASTTFATGQIEERTSGTPFEVALNPERSFRFTSSAEEDYTIKVISPRGEIHKQIVTKRRFRSSEKYDFGLNTEKWPMGRYRIIVTDSRKNTIHAIRMEVAKEMN